MRHGLSMSGLEQALRGHEEDLAATVTASMRDGGQSLLGDVREETRAALGHRLEKAWRMKVFPASGTSIDASAWVFTKASKIIDVFDRGAVIRSSRGLFLAIPTEAAGKRAPRADGSRGSARITPGGFERRTGIRLRFIYRRNGPSLLVADAAARDRYGRARKYSPRGRGAKLYGPEGRTVVVFILVPRVQVPKLLDLAAHAARVGADMPAIYARNWR